VKHSTCERSRCVFAPRSARARFVITIICLLLLAATPAFARELHVAPSGVKSNDGTAAHPLDLATALSSSSPARAGDTIWLHGGTYRGTFVSYLTGSATAPIIVRQYPGEHAIIDTNPSQSEGILAFGGWTWFWGFEITNSNPNRYSSQTGSWPTDVPRGYGITARGRALKFINLIVHDLANGFGVWIESVDTEVYGSVIYNNGWQAPDRAHGHGIYTQSQSARMRLTDNVLFNQFSHGLHGYGSDTAFLDYITMEGNIAFDNGIISKDGLARELLLGGGRTATSPEVIDNSTYGAQVNVGYSGGCTNAKVSGNYFVGTGVFIVNCAGTVSGNTMYSAYGVQSLPTSFVNNTFLAAAPTSTVIRVRPNRYEPGRANIAVYNWRDQPDVQVDLAQAGLAVGQAFEIRDTENYFGAPVVSGVYGGGAVRIPMTGLQVAAPVGNVPKMPQHTAPRFGAFVVLPTSTTSTPPAPSATFSANPQTIAPGGAATLTWSTTQATSVSIDKLGAVAASGSTTVKPAQTTTYTLTATGASGALTRSVTVVVSSGNAAPSVSLTSSASGTTLPAPASVTLNATASDSDGSIAEVRFYRNGVLAATDTSSPYSATLTGLAAGSYTVVADAVDNLGAITRAAAVNFTVTTAAAPAPAPAAANRLPIGYFVSPAGGGTYAKSGIRLEAIATDSDGRVVKVQFYDGSTLIGQSSAAPYVMTWVPSTVGVHLLSVHAIDDRGGVGTSAAISVTIR